jgi:hypothetical protein
MFEDPHPAAITGRWDGALLEPVAEINEQLLDRLHLMAVAAEPGEPGGLPALAGGRWRLLSLLADDWRRLDSKAQRRLAACPYLLLDAGFAQPERWETMPSAGVMDAAPCGVHFGGRAGAALVRRTLVLAWHLARCNRLMARVALGMTARSAERIANSRLRDLEALAELSPGWIVPRWEQQPNVWQQLIGAACRDNAAALRQAQLRGLQLLAGAAAQRALRGG